MTDAVDGRFPEFRDITGSGKGIESEKSGKDGVIHRLDHQPHRGNKEHDKADHAV